jgi:hypothetical protein
LKKNQFRRRREREQKTRKETLKSCMKTAKSLKIPQTQKEIQQKRKFRNPQGLTKAKSNPLNPPILAFLIQKL